MPEDIEKDERVEISIIVPILNEEENIRPLYSELTDTLSALNKRYEIIFIDDGSTDKGFEALACIQKEDTNVRVIQFRRNFGQTAALSAGFHYAHGDTIVTIDADLQNDPRDIPRLLERLEEGYDLVTGWRFDRKDPFLTRKLPSIIANNVISLITKVKLHDYGCTLKAFKREVVKNIRLYGEMHRFIPAIASWMGVSIAEVKVNHRARRAGKSKYGISRTIRVLLDLVTVKFLLAFSTRPIQIFGLIGFICGIIGFVTALYLTIQRLFFRIPLANRPLLLLAILLMFIGLQFITLGLLAELQARTYHEAQNKPIYVIRRILGKRD